jgi:cholesterol transport system auxiliary component
MKLLRVVLPLAIAAALGGCSLGGLLGGGGKTPPTLLRLTPEATPVVIQRSAAAGEAMTVAVPVISKELRTTRVPAQVGPYDVQYIENLQWVDTPDRLFQDLLAETVTRTTNRVVLDPNQSALDPGITVSGNLSRFGFDAQEGMVIVRYDAAMARAGGTGVTTRRFEAKEPADGTASSVAQGINAAANRVAIDVAQWVSAN